VGCTDQVK